MRTLRIATLLCLTAILLAACGQRQDPGTVAPHTIEQANERKAEQYRQVADNAPGNIYFGDLHVHTTFSPDAFITAMPVNGGLGPRPPADACDFARHCAALDFWSINDHAEGISPQRWRETRDIIRACNAVASDLSEPDMVSFLGYEWSQVSHYDRGSHYGHKNVIFRDIDDADVPSRPIAAPREHLGKSPLGALATAFLALRDFDNQAYYRGIPTYYEEIAETPLCAQGVPSNELPEDCHEVAADPATLFAKLRDWGSAHMVIPHGNAWGMNTPPGTTFDKQLNLAQHSPEQQYLFELYSGHGNAEEYRDWRAVAFDSEDRAYCPLPSDNYEPCCWRAGKIILQRCLAAGIEEAECQQRELAARQDFIDAGVSGHLTVPGQRVDDWLNCGQCEDCFNPAMDHRPAVTGQYALAISDFTGEASDPLRFKFGFIGASDNHRAAAGAGYKEYGRIGMTEANGPQNAGMERMLSVDTREPLPYSIPLHEQPDTGLARKRNMERQASFWMTGGLVAVHAPSRHREALWQGLERKQVYATSGDRILLWFDLVDDDARYAMGSELARSANPRFEVTAIGDHEQLPGCPDATQKLLGSDRLASLCLGECYNPSDTRKIIDRIEVVRIRPQSYSGEPVDGLIEDPWLSLPCEPSAQGCRVSFSDESFDAQARDTLYYVRAIQRPSLAVNAGGLRCERDEQGQCIAVDPCYGDFRTPASDDCLAPNAERAWSSPIFVNYTASP